MSALPVTIAVQKEKDRIVFKVARMCSIMFAYLKMHLAMYSACLEKNFVPMMNQTRSTSI